MQPQGGVIADNIPVLNDSHQWVRYGNLGIGATDRKIARGAWRANTQFTISSSSSSGGAEVCRTVRPVRKRRRARLRLAFSVPP